MLTQEENEFFTRVGPGTPAGTWLRRYWYPICPVTELTPETPTRYVRLLGEDLVMFKDKSGNVGLLRDRCPHRGASLVYGRVEERGIACAYHGWLYDCNGNLLETPLERNEALVGRIKQPAYHARKYAGLYWAYMGPDPVPEIPKWDVLERKDGRLEINVYQPIDCNWLQSIENSADPDHRQILHQEYVGSPKGREPAQTTRGRIDDIWGNDLVELWYGGIMKVRHFKNGLKDQHPLILPTILRQGQGLQLRQPIDDYTIWEIRVNFKPNKDGSLREDDDDVVVNYIEPHKVPGYGLRARPSYLMDRVAFQDYMCWETMGAISDRTIENLGASDECLVMFRNMVKANIMKTLEGEDPVGVFRDPDHEMIDTKLAENLGTLGASEIPDVPFIEANYPPIVPGFYAKAR